MIKLSPRLKAIADLVSQNSKIVDIGCDHGLVDIYLYQNNITSNIIASDINKNALENAFKNIKLNRLEDKIQLRLGNGLDVVSKEDNVDTIIISGMGSHTIVGILKNNLFKLRNIKTIIIESNNQHEFLRTEITKLGYFIDNEVIVKDGNKIYIIIKFIKGKKKYTKKELYFGPVLLKENTELFKEYTNIKLTKLKILIKLIPNKKKYTKNKLLKEIKLYK